MEAAFCCIALKDQFLPGSAHITTPDPELGHLKLLRKSQDHPVKRIMSNSSGFGGANVSVIFEKA
jgi:3-oxoacyl-[acyl-carrier-protein] synthase-1